MASTDENPLIFSRLTLGDGKVMPMLGFGTYQIKPEDATAAVLAALQTGYRHIGRIVGNVSALSWHIF